MWPPTDIMRGPLTNNLLEMTFVERNQVVKTFATKAPAQSLAHRVGLGGSHRRPQNSHPQVRQTLVDLLSEEAVAIVDQEAVEMIARQRFPELLQRPFRRGMGSYVVVDNHAGSDLYDDEDVEGAEGGGDHHEEVAGHHDLGMIPDEGQPALFRVRRAHGTISVEVLADGARGDLNGQLELQFVGDALLSPGRVLRGHFSDESAQVFGDLRSANSRDFQPEQTESLAVPAEEGIGLDVHQGVTPREHAAQNHHHQSCGIMRPAWLHLPLLKQRELFSQIPPSALHVTRRYVTANWPNGVFADYSPSSPAC